MSSGMFIQPNEQTLLSKPLEKVKRLHIQQARELHQYLHVCYILIRLEL